MKATTKQTSVFHRRYHTG